MTTPRIAAVATLGALLALLPGPGGRLLAAPRSRDGPPLRFRASFPARGLQFVGTDEVVLRFSTDVDFSTLEGGAVRVEFGPQTVAGSFAPGRDRRGEDDLRLVVFTPDAPLPPDQQIRFRVSTAATSALGRPLEDPVDFSFWTSPSKGVQEVLPIPEGTRLVRAPRLGPRPEVTWTFPGAGFGNVFSDIVRIRFSRPMAMATVEEGFRVLTGGVAPVPGTLTFPPNDATEVLFTPKDRLPPSTDFEMVVSRDARTERGRSLGEEFRASFGTSPRKDGVKPLRPGDFQPGPDLAVGRAFHTATSLSNGDVLLAGGEGGPGVSLAAAEVFRRSSTTVLRVGDMAEARRKHAAVALPGGRVLVCGGFGDAGSALASAEICDAATGTWSPAASMGSGRANHTATLLANGTVLVAGGFTGSIGSLRYEGYGEIYNPAGNTWSSAGALAVPRGGHTATTLPDGRVLLAGGESSFDPAAEVWDPGDRVFRITLGRPRFWRRFHAAETVRLGSVLLAGGGPGTAERFDPFTETFSDAGNCPPIGLPVSDSPLHATLTRLPGTRVMFLGGIASGAYGPGLDAVLSQVQLWDANSGGGYGAFFPMTFAVEPPRAGHTVTDLQDGRYLAAGGVGTSQSTAERRTTLVTPSEE